MSWTNERVDLLRKLWEQGLSASQIAAQLGGGVTRNAVIGKVHRLGFAGRQKAASTGQSAARPRTKTTTATVAAAPVMRAVARGNTVVMRQAEPEVEVVAAPQTLPEDVVVPMSERVTIMELKEAMCRWPMGDPLTAEFRFCGARCTPGTAYCGYHSRIAYQPASDRRRDR